ncbi:MMPL family transporter [Streptomyces sp. NBC_00080]|uniref:MMPL family transporter n=1 Tax=unclassified Streptomyces TaxID=2593676 RepID=UPI0011512247|nr:MMPL family transporter [Streptomyces sp. SLBN-115]
MAKELRHDDAQQGDALQQWRVRNRVVPEAGDSIDQPWPIRLPCRLSRFRHCKDGSRVLTNALGELARWSFRHRRSVLSLAVLLIVACAALGFGTGIRWSNGGYTAEDTAAERAEHMARKFGAGTADLVLYARPGRAVVSPDVAAQGRQVTELAQRSPGVRSALSYWTTGLEPLRSADGKGALLRIDLEGDESQEARTASTLVPALRAAAPRLALSATGPSWINVQGTTQAQHDLLRSELLALPFITAVLVLAFGSLGATLVPVLIGGLAVTGSLAALAAATRVFPVSVFAANLSVALGFGLAVDYGLFTLSRYREERARGLGGEEAVVGAIRTAGRSVMFCAVTMIWCMAALLVFPLGLVRSLALASIVVVVSCVITTLLVLPALLGALGDRLERFDPFRWLPWRRSPLQVSVSPTWRRIAVAVTGRPLLWSGMGAATLLTLALPAIWLRPALMDESILPAQVEAHAVADRVRADFPNPPERQLTVVLPKTDPGARSADLDAYARRLAELPGQAGVSTLAGDYAKGRLVKARQTDLPHGTGTLLVVFAAKQPQSASTAALLNKLRATSAPGPAYVAGVPAQLADTASQIRIALPWWAGLMLGGTLLGLLAFTRSLVVAVKAAVLGGLSITAALGLMVLFFQDLGLLGPPAGGGDPSLEITMPLLASALAFGLCVDYEVFLIARMAEEWQRTRENTDSIVFGIERTGRLFTAAALVVAVSMGALVLSRVTLLVVLGATMAAVVVLDATVVRGVLVPAVMQLAGRANWWSPTLRRRGAAATVSLEGIDHRGADEICEAGRHTAGQQ